MSSYPRPVASPVDTFAPAEVRRGDSGAAGLAQLADSLSRFNPALSSFAGTYAYAQQAEAERDARALQTQRQFKSLQELKGAVDRGEISEDANPWKMVFLKQLVGRNEVRLTAQQIEQEYETSDVRWKDNPAEVEAFVQERLSKLGEGRDSWELAAIGPAADEFRNQFVAGHINRRAKERDWETQVGFTRQVGQDASRALAAIASGEEPDLTSMQQAINAAGMVVHPEKLRQWATESVASAALASRDPEAAERLMGMIRIGDKSLTETLPAGAMAQLREEITDKQIHDLRFEAAQEERLERDRFKAASRLFDTWYRQQRTEGAEVSLVDSNLFIDQLNVDPETRRSLKKMADELSKERVSELLADQMQLAVDGRTTEADTTNFMQVMVSHLHNGRDAVFTMKNLNAAMQEDTWGELDSDSGRAVIDILYNTPDPKAAFTALEGLRSSGTIDRPTYFQVAERIFQSPMQDAEKHAQVRRVLEDVGQRLSLAYIADPSMVTTSMNSMGEETTQLTPAAEMRIAAAQREIDAAYWRFVTDPANRAVTLDALLQHLDKVSTDVVTRNGGLSAEQVQDRVLFSGVEQQIAEGNVTDYSTVAVWEEGKLLLKVGDKTKEFTKPLFRDSQQFATKVDAVMDQLNIESDADREAFKVREAEKLGDPAVINMIRDQLLVKEFGDSAIKARNERLTFLRSEYEKQNKTWMQWMRVMNQKSIYPGFYFADGKWKPLPTTDQLKQWQKILIEYRKQIRELEHGKGLEQFKPKIEQPAKSPQKESNAESPVSA